MHRNLLIYSSVCLALLIALAPQNLAAESEQNIPDFSGYWVRPEAGNGRMFYSPENGPGPLLNIDETRDFTIGDHTSLILLPHAAEAVKAHGDQGRAGQVVFPAWSLCWPPGVPLALNMAEPVQFLQNDNQVMIFYQRGFQYRQIDLNVAHPENLKPSWNGHSVGHYEGEDTLVIDTIAHDTRAVVDRFGTPKSDALRLVERYTVSADRQTLNVAFEVEDPKTFTTRWFAKMAYVRPTSRPGYDPDGFNRDGEAINENICAENNKDAAGGFLDIPYATGEDF